jgi:hypothetical protein
MKTIGPNEIRVVIQPRPAPGAGAGPTPAAVLKRLFDAVLAVLTAADRELHSRATASEFHVAHLSFAPCAFGFVEKLKSEVPAPTSAIELFRRCAGRVYRSDYQILLKYPRLMRAFHRLAGVLDPAYIVVIRTREGELPLDAFFRRQLDRVGVADEPRPLTDMCFAGAAIATFEGRLAALDYRDATWTGRLVLAGGEAQIECVFDRSMGEDALNPLGNKNVCVAGRAIYTGDSQLPERIEVTTIEVLPRAPAAVDIRGALAPAAIGEWRDGIDHIHEP